MTGHSENSELYCSLGLINCPDIPMSDISIGDVTPWFLRCIGDIVSIPVFLSFYEAKEPHYPVMPHSCL